MLYNVFLAHAFSIYYGSEEPIELLNRQEIIKMVRNIFYLIVYIQYYLVAGKLNFNQLLNVLCSSNQVDTDLLCQVDAKPSLSPADNVVFHVKLPGDDHFVETESNIVFSSDIIEGSLYKCVFYEESSDTSYDSGDIYFIKGIIMLPIRKYLYHY